MKKFSYLSKRELKNAQHYDFIEAFIAVCLAANFVAAKILSALATLRALFAVEDSLFLKSRASEVIARRNVANKLRISYYIRLRRLVLVWAGSGIAPYDEAATALKKIFDLYRLNTKAQLNELSGGMTNLGIDLSTEANLARIEAIGGTVLLNGMIAANEEVKAYYIEQGTEESQKVSEALLKARKATDEAYDDLCDIIEATAVISEDTAPYQTFIQQWNGTIKLYNDMLDRKNGVTGSGSDSGSEAGGGSGGSGSSGSGGNGANGSANGQNGSNGSEEPSNPTNPSNPSNPSEPGTGGSSGGGTGGNGGDGGGGDGDGGGYSDADE